MKLSLTGWGWDILTIEIGLLRPTEGDDEPIVTSTPHAEIERAEEIEPDTWVFGFTAS